MWRNVDISILFQLLLRPTPRIETICLTELNYFITLYCHWIINCGYHLKINSSQIAKKANFKSAEEKQFSSCFIWKDKHTGSQFLVPASSTNERNNLCLPPRSLVALKWVVFVFVSICAESFCLKNSYLLHPNNNSYSFLIHKSWQEKNLISRQQAVHATILSLFNVNYLTKGFQSEIKIARVFQTDMRQKSNFLSIELLL